MKRTNSSGFTVIELLIATAVFSVVLMICSIVIVQLGRLFYKGIITGRTQDVTRKIVNDFTQAAQFSSQQPTPPVTAPYGGITVSAICIGGVRYSFTTEHSLGTQPGQTRHVLWRDRFSGVCTPLDITAANPGNNGEELLTTDMRLPRFVPTTVGDFITLDITVAYGATDDLFEPGTNRERCIGSAVGGQFCAVSRFTTSVKNRLTE